MKYTCKEFHVLGNISLVRLIKTRQTTQDPYWHQITHLRNKAWFLRAAHSPAGIQTGGDHDHAKVVTRKIIPSLPRAQQVYANPFS